MNTSFAELKALSLFVPATLVGLTLHGSNWDDTDAKKTPPNLTLASLFKERVISLPTDHINLLGDKGKLHD